MGKIEDILIDGNQRNASDIHLCPGSPVMFRIDGDLIPMCSVKEERMRWHFVSFHLRFRHRRI